MSIPLLIASIYLLGLAAFLVGLFRGLRRSATPDTTEPVVTALVCARNEEQNIDQCLQSLSNLDYPTHKLQIIVVDDNSSDKTSAHLLQWKTQLKNLEVITLQDAENTTGKVNALIVGIDAAKGEFVCITDADCQVPPRWIRNYLHWYDNDTGMVSSVTITNRSTPTAVAQSFEMMQLLGMSMAGINLGIPVSIIGNNLSIRREAYESIGGYRAIPFSVTEDVALFQAMWRSKWHVQFKANDELLVTTNPPGSLTSWWRQKQRWVVGAKSLGFIGWFILILGYVGMLSVFCAFATIPFTEALIVLAVKLLADLLILLPIMRSLRRIHLIWCFPFYQIYLLFFLLCVPLQYLQRTVVWKERDYHT